MAVHVLGIRHHGPGSARGVVRALEALDPDAILIEGPPDAEAVLSLAGHPEMTPPVALLVYAVDDPKKAAFYPFAEFSPEWRAIRFGLARGVPVRFIDLPQAHRLAEAEDEAASSSDSPLCNVETDDARLAADPIAWLARAAGFEDGERWWESLVEHRRDTRDVFTAIMEAMAALRESGVEHAGLDRMTEARREAHMRQSIRAAQKDGFSRIAVVCGAWHAPALADMPPAKQDAELLKKLPKIKTQATWVPWTADRLSYASGYGAGIESPGWYQHLWDTWDRATGPTEVAIRWLIRVADAMRTEGLDVSVAHVIEAVRLAETLATLRGRPLPGLDELNEAVQSAICSGDDAPMRLIHRKLIVGEVLGRIPDDAPTVPVQQDLAREQKRLRLAPEAAEKLLELDLRKPNDLDRSHLLHRLALLEIPWGYREAVSGKLGTFHEHWRLRWQPEFSVKLVEAAKWGNTVAGAASNIVRDRAGNAGRQPSPLAFLTELANAALLADLQEAVPVVMACLRNEAALTGDVAHLLDAIPPLATVMRYGTVRKTDANAVREILDGLVLRACIGLPGACASLDDDAAKRMADVVGKVNDAVRLIELPDHVEAWNAALDTVSARSGVHGLVAGRCCRLLHDARAVEAAETARRFRLALSPAVDPMQAGAWVEGFLTGSALVLLHDDEMWRVLDDWVTGLPGETFTNLVPLLCRTFALFAPAERRQMGEQVKRRGAVAMSPATGATENFDCERADAVLPVIARLLGISEVI